MQTSVLRTELEIMIQGTTSDAGKSVIAAGLCRVLKRRGHSVAPFKPQNMALNSAVTADGGEIGRAQAVQAQACGLASHTDMNPVLLKPNSDTGAQVIVNGHSIGEMNATTYHQHKPKVLDAIVSSYARLRETYQALVVEGAGSPAEINLRDNDVANMGFAEVADVPVIIVADIDRGGVFAHLYGTLELLSESEQKRVKGFLINRFRGDIKLLESGLDWLEQETGKPVLGVLPYLHGLDIEAEDAINASQTVTRDSSTLNISVPVFTRMSNHTDFDALRLNPCVDVHYVRAGQPLPPSDLIVLPGTKSTRTDLAFLKSNGWDNDIERHLRYGGKVIGICGGFQMLGQWVHDPEGIEGDSGKSAGLGWLESETIIQPNKQLRQVQGVMSIPGYPPARVSGYEIHAGHTTNKALRHPIIQLENHTDGVLSDDNQILGTYLHGLFDHPEACQRLLEWAGLEKPQVIDTHQLREQGINRMAEAIEQHVDLNRLMKAME